MSDDWIGRIIDARYIVEGVLGSGGMGMVLRARHKFTGGYVAVKVLKPELAADPEIQARFLAEARAANTIGHPNIVQVIDAGRSNDGVLYLAMELLQGRSLREPLARAELKPADMRSILDNLLDALAAAHARGFVHRDLKPENVFLVPTQSGVVAKLLDFGIAKVIDTQNVASVRTATGSMLGTPAYMSPEQIANPSSVDVRTDLWAVGVMVYEMLTGRLPFPGGTVGELMVAVATQPPRSIKHFIPTASPQLEQFFARALSREVSARFSSANEMRAALNEVLSLRPSQPVGIAATQSAGMVGLGAQTPPPVGAQQMTMATGYSAPAGSQMTQATGYGTGGPAMPAPQTPSSGTPGYATPPSGTPGIGGLPPPRLGVPITPSAGTPGYAPGSTGATPHYTPGSTGAVYPMQTNPTPAFPTGTNTSPSTTALVAPSNKTPWVIAIVGTFATVAIVLAIVLTRAKSAPQVAQNPPSPSTPVTTPTSGDANPTTANPTANPNTANANTANTNTANTNTANTNHTTNNATANNSTTNNSTTNRSTTNNSTTNHSVTNNSVTNNSVSNGGKSGTRPQDPYKDPKTPTPPTLAGRPQTPTSQAPGATAPTTPQVKPQTPTAPAATNLSVDERCQAGCNAARSCGLATSSCIADCKANQAVRACTDLALAKKCGDAAVCALRATCGGVQLGGNTCKAAATCQASFCTANDFACGCKCATNISAHSALALMRVDVCAINCNFDQTCIQQRCMVWLQACQQQ